MCQELSLLFYINSLSSQESREEGILTSILQIRKMGLDDVWGSSEFTWLQSGGAQDFHSPSSGFSTGRFCPFHSANIGADTCYVTDTLDAVWASLRPGKVTQRIHHHRVHSSWVVCFPFNSKCRNS